MYKQQLAEELLEMYGPEKALEVAKQLVTETLAKRK